MTIHMVKLCVGADDVDDLVNWQKRLMKQGREPFHQTRMMPKQKEQLLNGGSIYWVIKGAIRVRQRILDIREVAGDGHSMCELVFSPDLVRTYAKQKRPFQGWRYLKPGDAPRDLNSKEAAVDIPPSLDAALKQAGVW